jgi:hypothetical protein
MCTLMVWVHHRRPGRTDGYAEQHQLGNGVGSIAPLYGNSLSYSLVIDNVKTG